MKSLRWWVATLLVVALAACNTFAVTDSTGPEVFVNVGSGVGLIEGEDFELIAWAVDTESGISRLQATFGEADMGILIVEDEERSIQPVEIRATVQGIQAGASYEVVVTAVNGVGLETARTVTVVGVAAP